jgi:hypothetical protein
MADIQECWINRKVISGMSYLVKYCPISELPAKTILLHKCRRCEYHKGFDGVDVKCAYPVKGG